MKKKHIFLLFVLILFSSCVKNVEKCSFLPGVELESQKKDESQEKIENTEEKQLQILEN